MYNDAFAKFPVIETERLILRELSISDAEDVYEYGKDVDAFIYVDGFPSEYEEVKEVIKIWTTDAYNSMQFIRWGVELKAEKKIIGGVFLFSPHGSDQSGRRMDIGYEISRKYWNLGYGTEAVKAVVAYGFEKMGLKRITAEIIPENKASIRAFEKAGFTYEGTLKNYRHYQYNGDELKTMVMMACTHKE
ncbi:MAG TPA: GNAT family protein [Clostridia bacterium]|nr:GNAT family protein [Clostridia bacterium]